MMKVSGFVSLMLNNLQKDVLSVIQGSFLLIILQAICLSGLQTIVLLMLSSTTKAVGTNSAQNESASFPG